MCGGRGFDPHSTHAPGLLVNLVSLVQAEVSALLDVALDKPLSRGIWWCGVLVLGRATDPGYCPASAPGLALVGRVRSGLPGSRLPERDVFLPGVAGTSCDGQLGAVPKRSGTLGPSPLRSGHSAPHGLGGGGVCAPGCSWNWLGLGMG